ncbi:MAG TPA: methyltransferase domain-containing protein [Hyphomonadaceae bacterium]|nr:methyltransferase domain-containing protein [Hyphomonadaceae bacterium]HPN06066.1 methyltransferase domain-containing protein [Hyphomonadaceae bacterium]
MTRNILKITGASLVALAFATACGGEAPAPAEPAPAPVAEAPPVPAGPDYASFVASTGRTAEDTAKDANRKPAEVLAFTKIMPGQTVFEMEAGAGYYTELFSLAAGSTGKVIMQAPKEFEGFYKDALAARTKDNRLANVTVSWSPFDKLDATDGSVDVVTWFQGPHELYCAKACGNAVMGDPAKAFAEVARILKPGGTFIIMDHIAPVGAPTTSGNDVHRIDTMAVKAMATTAGFALDEESALLANPADDHTKGVFDPSIQGKTDQFLLRYKKP